jgi:hypothetical protein
MAFRYAVASGNWNNTATWDGLTTVPTASDDVFSNGFTVTIDGTFTVLSIRSTLNAVPVIAAGGQFRFANGGNLTCTAAQAIYVGSTTPTLEMTLASPNTAIFSGSVLTLTNTANYIAIRNSASGILTLNGNYNIDGSSTGRVLISHTSTGTTNIISSTISSTVTSGGAGIAVNIIGNGIVNITGNISGSNASGSISNSPIVSNIGTLNITGNTTAATSAAAFLTGSVNYTQIGNVNASTTQVAIYNNTAAATISVTGIITAGTGAPAIYSAFGLTSGYGSGTFVKVSGNVVNTNNVMAIVAPRVTIDTATSSWLFQISTGGNRTLYAAGVALGNPAITDVRLGTVYGASNELTGTLIVPSPSNVLQGVGTDATVGTLLMTPQQFWDHLISTGFAANSIGDRLQNASTVATTGGQIASYNI